MTKRESQISADYLHSVLRYDKATGSFHWLVDRRRCSGTIFAAAGDRAGWTDGEGYRAIKFRLGRREVPIREHRLAWFFVHGEWPPCEIDHINGVRNDNRIENLRLADRQANSWNLPLRSTNTSGFKGASYCRTKRKWVAQIVARGKRYHLGYFTTAPEAGAAYAKAAAQHFGEFVRAPSTTEGAREAAQGAAGSAASRATASRRRA